MEIDELAAAVHRRLLAAGSSVASAESLTGGELAARLSATPGASATFVGGAVTYATELKTSLLGVTPELIAAHGVISAECAEAMATGVRRLTGADWGVSTTGVAGPDRQEDREVGTVFAGIAGPSGVHVVHWALAGDRASIRRATCDGALAALLDAVTS